MRRLLLPLVVLACFLGVGPPSCGRSNPDYCAPDAPCPKDKRCVPSPNLNTGEGTCVALADLGGAVCQSSLTCGSDQPLCDARVGVCRACLPGEDSLCSARSGGDTPRCAGGRCVQCALPPGVTRPRQVPECTARGAPKPGQAPVCDGNQCRGCLRHDECDSGVCVKDSSGELYKLSQGTCVPVEQVLAVSSVACSPTGPVYCRPADAIKRLGQQVDAGSRFRYLVFQSGGLETDFSEIQLGTEAAHRGLDLHLISAPSADDPVTRMDPAKAVPIGGKGRGFVVSGDVRVTLEGFYVRNASIGVDCSGAGAVETQVRVLRSWLTENSAALQATFGCTLIVEDSAVGGRSGKEPGNRGSVATINRSDFQFINTIAANNGDPSQTAFNGFGGIKIYGSLAGRKTSRIVNSLFFQNSVTLQSRLMMQQRASAVWCDLKLDKPLVLLNSLVMQGAFAAPSAVGVDPNCGDQVLISSVLADDAQTAKPESPVMVDQLGAWGTDFIPRGTPGNEAQRRLHQGGLKELSIITDVIPAPPRDLTDAARPAGKIAIGPFEPRP